MGKRELIDRAILVPGDESEVLARSKVLEANNVDLVGAAELVVVGLIHEGKSKHALLLQVGLVDTSEGADNDSKTTEEAGFESSVFTGGTFTVVVVTDDDPLDTLVTVFGSNLGNTTPLAGELVLDLVGLAVLSVDGADQAVLCSKSQHNFNFPKSSLRTGDVLEMSTVLEPGSTSRDVIGCALALDLDENWDILRVFAIPGLEGLKELETVGGGRNSDLDRGTVSGRGLESILSRVVSADGELIATGRRELERLARGSGNRIGQRVEGQRSAESESGDDIGRSDKAVSSGVRVVTASEVTVVRSDNWAKDKTKLIEKKKTTH